MRASTKRSTHWLVAGLVLVTAALAACSSDDETRVTLGAGDPAAVTPAGAEEPGTGPAPGASYVPAGFEASEPSSRALDESTTVKTVRLSQDPDDRGGPRIVVSVISGVKDAGADVQNAEGKELNGAHDVSGHQARVVEQEDGWVSIVWALNDSTTVWVNGFGVTLEEIEKVAAGVEVAQ